MLFENLHLQWIEFSKKLFDIFLVGQSAGPALPFRANAGLLQNPSNMIFLENAHVAPYFFVFELNVVTGKECHNGSYGCERTMVDHGSCPIEDYGFKACHDSIFSSVSAATPNESVIPAPPGEVTIRTPGAASNER